MCRHASPLPFLLLLFFNFFFTELNELLMLHNGCLASSPTPSCLVRAAVNAATDELKCVFGVTDAFVKKKK